MYKIFTGDDRVEILKRIKSELGEDYEVFEGDRLAIFDIMNICIGTSLFGASRKILLKDLTLARKTGGEEERVDFYEELLKYPETPHKIIIWESVTPIKKTYKDFVKNSKAEVIKVMEKKPVDIGKVFDIYDTALRDGKKAVAMLKEIEEKQDPYMFFGLLVSQALKKYDYHQGAKEKRVLEALSQLDIQMKSTTISPWQLLQAFLLQVSWLQ